MRREEEASSVTNAKTFSPARWMLPLGMMEGMSYLQHTAGDEEEEEEEEEEEREGGEGGGGGGGVRRR